MASDLTRLETRTKEFNMRASCWEMKPASVVKASHGSAVDLARSGNVQATVRPAHRRLIICSRGSGEA